MESKNPHTILEKCEPCELLVTNIKTHNKRHHPDDNPERTSVDLYENEDEEEQMATIIEDGYHENSSNLKRRSVDLDVTSEDDQMEIVNPVLVFHTPTIKPKILTRQASRARQSLLQTPSISSQLSELPPINKLKRRSTFK